MFIIFFNSSTHLSLLSTENDGTIRPAENFTLWHIINKVGSLWPDRPYNKCPTFLIAQQISAGGLLSQILQCLKSAELLMEFMKYV
jgi:hypothetical protein